LHTLRLNQVLSFEESCSNANVWEENNATDKEGDNEQHEASVDDPAERNVIEALGGCT
jgi:hypothetical protein